MNNKTVNWPPTCPISDLFCKGELILGSAYTLPSIELPLSYRTAADQVTVYHYSLLLRLTRTAEAIYDF